MNLEAIFTREIVRFGCLGSGGRWRVGVTFVVEGLDEREETETRG